MDTEYDQALYYMYHCLWNDLLVLMVDTPDDIFSKKIEHFLHAFKYEKDISVLEKNLNELFLYIDHATSQTEFFQATSEGYNFLT